MAFKKIFVVSDESVNSHGFRIITSGIRLDNAKNNCPCFYDHNTWEVPLGHWENLRVENNRLVADLVINGDNDREKNYINKIQNGDIKGCSVGADPLKWNEDPIQLLAGQTRATVDECELVEISITPLPGNTGALALKHQGSLILLNAANENIIPLLNPTTDMKQIALKLGLGETATEQQILDAIVAVQLKAANAVQMEKVIEEHVASKLPAEQKEFFVQLSKTDISQAMGFLKLNKDAADVIENAAEPLKPVAGAKPGVVKNMKVTDMIQQGRKVGDGNGGGEENATFDYLQKKNPLELKRIHSEEPERYLELAKAYKGGVRYTGK